MRRALFSLLILLTAFRGMVGDAMAYGMTQQALHSLNTIESIAQPADFAAALGHVSSERAASMPCHEATDDPSTNGNSHSCSSCMVCHSPVIERSTSAAGLVQHVTVYAKPQEHDWVSAELSRLQKPPVF